MYICIYKCEYGGKQEKEKERERLGCGEDCMNEQHADLFLILTGGYILLIFRARGGQYEREISVSCLL